MERWDFDCQECGRNIGDAWYVDPVWYICSQDKNKHELLKAVYPRTLYSIKEEDVILEDKKVPKKMANEIISSIKDLSEKRFEYKPPRKTWSIFSCAGWDLYIDFEKQEVVWALSGEESKYYEKAGIKKHEIKGRGWGRLGYTFDAACAEKLGYKCNICDSELVKITADQHPGGQWGVRGTPIEPAPMRHAIPASVIINELNAMKSESEQKPDKKD